MTLTEMRKEVLKLIEEYDLTDPSYTKDPDINTKLNSVINHIMYELSRVKKIPDYKEMTVTKDQVYSFSDIDSEHDIYQLDMVKGVDYEYKAQGTKIKALENGTAEIEYFRYPDRITDLNASTYEFELSNDVLECMAVGVAGDILKSDVSNAYGNIYSQRYEAMKQQIDVRYNTGGIEIGDGI